MAEGYELKLRGTNQEQSRPYNRRIVLEFIRSNGPAARSVIASRVGLTVQTVSTIVRELEEQGYLTAVREKPKGRGTPPQTLHLNPNGGYAIGLNVSPLGVDAGLMNLGGDLIASTSRSVPQPEPTATFELIEQLIDEMRASRPEGRILGVGMALPGPFEVQAMSFVGPTTLHSWADVPVRELLAEVAKVPAFLAADTTAAALGTTLYGEGAGLRQFYYLHLGAGLGGTMVKDGTPLRGAWGNAGEIGHIPMVPDGRACSCGNRGCLERYISLDSYAQRPKNQSDAEWVAEMTPVFQRAIITIENLFDPETIVLGGLGPTALLERLAAIADDLPVSVSARQDRTMPRVIASADRQSILRGAAALAVSGVLSPRQDTPLPEDRPRRRDPFSNGIAA